MKSNRFFSCAAALLITAAVAAQPGEKKAGQPDSREKPTILLSGASFASSNNGWFEFGCEALGAIPMNRAVGSESIADCAQKMHDGTLYSKEEFEEIDAFVIMQVHDRNVLRDEQGRMYEKYTDYPFPFERGNYAGAFDYVIKKYITDCYNLKFDPRSKYYGKRAGKPAVIVLCTHWHDGRTLYNSTVRQLAAKWGLPLVEFDTNIGFTKETPHPVTGEQVSRLFAGDVQELGGEKFGWHPQPGNTYIQRRMAAIFADKMRQILPLVPCAE